MIEKKLSSILYIGYLPREGDFVFLSPKIHLYLWFILHQVTWCPTRLWSPRLIGYSLLFLGTSKSVVPYEMMRLIYSKTISLHLYSHSLFLYLSFILFYFFDQFFFFFFSLLFFFSLGFPI